MFLSSEDFHDNYMRPFFPELAVMKQLLLCSFFIILVLNSFTQTKFPEQWRAMLVRKDSNTVVFTIKTSVEQGKNVFYILNASEKIKVNSVQRSDDSVFFTMPVFESAFKTKINSDGSLQGIWNKGTSGETQAWPFFAFPNQPYRFKLTTGNAKNNINGRWDVTITRANGTLRKAVAEFVQKGNHLTGTFLTPSGDYRYLDGIVTGDSLKLSTFDGAHAYTFYAKIDNPKNISGGVFYSGIIGTETWTARKDPTIKTPEQNEATRLQEGESKLNFAFNDLEDRPVSIKDVRYKNKVVIIQIMGSWCPNCLDETKFLNEYYNKNKSRGVEVIALAYEYSTDKERSKKSLKKFQQLFNVQYPMLLTGATSSDDLKTEKTLPQLTPIRSFPTTIILDKKGNVREISGTFYGPGTGKYFDDYKKEFNATIDKLLNEK